MKVSDRVNWALLDGLIIELERKKLKQRRGAIEFLFSKTEAYRAYVQRSEDDPTVGVGWVAIWVPVVVPLANKE